MIDPMRIMVIDRGHYIGAEVLHYIAELLEVSDFVVVRNDRVVSEEDIYKIKAKELSEKIKPIEYHVPIEEKKVKPTTHFKHAHRARKTNYTRCTPKRSRPYTRM